MARGPAQVTGYRGPALSGLRLVSDLLPVRAARWPAQEPGCPRAAPSRVIRC